MWYIYGKHTAILQHSHRSYLRSSRCSFEQKSEMLRQLFEGLSLNISPLPAARVVLTSWTVNKLLGKFPVTDRDYLQSFIGPADGFMFTLREAGWTPGQVANTVNLRFRLELECAADLKVNRSANLTEEQRRAIVANLTDYVRSKVPPALADQAKLTVNYEGNVIQGHLTVQN
jgi:hypothetical protein